jgi:hypothetical protein
MTEEQQRGASATTSVESSSTNRNEILVNANNSSHDNDERNNATISEIINEIDDSPKSKRPKVEVWLQYRGKRHTRVGDEYQVNLLPKPQPTGSSSVPK